jgi:glycosyltransferase involved in cell wall biosynthesis
MKKEYLVSVILPVFNGEEFLDEAIRSIKNQTYGNIEIIVIDDGSTDKSGEIAQAYPEIIFKYQVNQGVACARNHALDLAKGDFIAFLDADDCYPENKISTQIEYLTDNQNWGGCIGHEKNFIDSSYDISAKDYEHFMHKEKIGLITLVARKYVFEKVGKFNRDYVTGSDFEWFTRANELGVKIPILPMELLNRRIHANNLSIKGKGNSKAVRFRIMRESLQRKAERN